MHRRTVQLGPRRKMHVRFGAGLLALLAACALLIYFAPGYYLERREGDRAPVPVHLADQIVVLGLPNARFWAWYDTQGAMLANEWAQALDRERAIARLGEPLPAGHFLAVSGGGAEGAFGAGLICGWADAGTMPVFKLVTGVSTGSMIAPFAFLGGPYIDRLRSIYTTIADKDIRTLRALNGLYGVVFGDALSDTTPLYRLISRYVDEPMLADIAVAYNRGRLLMIATASLDQQRPVLWNIGAIAASGHPGALELIRKVILASASIPGAFPPVMIDVEANGRRFQEMNVDAGVVAQTFLYPTYLGLREDVQSERFLRERVAYVIRNSRLDPNWASVNRDFLTITERAISTMIHFMGYSDMLQIYEASKRDNVDYNLAFIGTDFVKTKRALFDPEYMKALFDYAFEKGRRGYHWHKAPPILERPAVSE